MTTLSIEQKAKLKKALGYWLAGFAVIAGFMYYHSTAPLGPILIAGVLTFAFTLYQGLKP
jgi:hypothetical protein